MQLSWQDTLKDEKTSSYFKKIIRVIENEAKTGKTTLPSRKNIFNAFKYCKLQDLKIVILGQDPYHGINQANGLAFSVEKNVKVPPSLVNIYKELHSDLKLPMPLHGSLVSWARQGVFLMNATLTVELNKPNSHKNIGWSIFTDNVIKTINNNKENVVFMLWGKHAQKKINMIDEKKHLILSTSHPSPLSYQYGFSGCKHFSKSNVYLKKHNIKTVDWTIK